MNAVLAVAWREVRERWPLLVVPVVPVTLLGLFLLPSLAPYRRVDEGALGLLVAFLGGLVPAAIALVVGASILARDAADGRMRFLLARPLTAFSLWAGKALGAGILIGWSVACGTLVFALTAPGSDRHVRGGHLRWAPFVIWVTAVCFAAAVSHLASTALRSRSRSLWFDLAGATVTTAVWLLLVRQLALAGAVVTVLAYVFPALMAWGFVTVLAGALAQVSVGRADVARGHRALSSTVWLLAGVGLSGVWGFSAWLRSTSPAQLGVGWPRVAAPTGPAVVFGGGDPWGGGRFNYWPVFLLNGDTGRWTAVAGDRFSPPAFSPDGRRAAWVSRPPEVPWPGNSHDTLSVARLDTEAPLVEERPLGPGDWGVVLAMDGSGSRAAVGQASQVSIIDTASGRETASVPLRPLAAVFRADGSLRLFAAGAADAALIVLDCDLLRGSQAERARFAPGVGVRSVRLADASGDLAFVETVRGRSMLDVGTSASFELPSQASSPTALADGSIAFGLPGDLRLAERSGRPLRSIPIGPGRPVAITEIEPGQLAIEMFDPTRTPQVGLSVVDVGSGRVLREQPGARLMWRHWHPPPTPGSPGARLFTVNGGLSRLEPDGTVRVLVPEQE
jgi:hypothetical protein